MRRLILWFASTAVVVTLLFGYRTSTSPGLVQAASGEPAITASTTSSAPATTGESGTGTGTASGSGSGSGSTAGTTTDGDSVLTRYGPVQVQVTTQGSTITSVSVLAYPNGDGHSAQLSSYALPTLIQETLDQQSAQVDMVSGATYTSVGYEQSLQSALDSAGV